jgi:hypothetical protein
MPPRYAANTEVPIDRSKAEIEATLRRYGAAQFMSGWDETRAVLGFVIHGRQVRFVLPMPARNSHEFSRTATGRDRSTAAAQAEYEKAVRQRWRVLALVVKAKLEAVEAGVVTFEDEFLAHLVLPNGQTVGDQVRDGVRQAYASGHVPALLPDYRPALTAGSEGQS